MRVLFLIPPLLLAACNVETGTPGPTIPPPQPPAASAPGPSGGSAGGGAAAPAPSAPTPPPAPPPGEPVVILGGPSPVCQAGDCGPTIPIDQLQRVQPADTVVMPDMQTIPIPQY